MISLSARGFFSFLMLVGLLGAGLLTFAPNLTAHGQEPPFAKLDSEYQQQTLPLVEQYCASCHSTSDKEGELDLEQFDSLDKIRKHPQSWQRVAEMLASGAMPPEDADQPTPEQRQQLQNWISRYLQAEARANAGDPGPVVLRRLNNAEYTYTLRDLTGIDSLQPAREFPVDGGAGEGFTNTGNALVMSPGLITKFFDAAKEVANHAVLLPDGIRFSPSTTRRDWTNEVLAQIRAFYHEFDSAPSKDAPVNWHPDLAQGVQLPLEKYLTATLAEREKLRSGDTTLPAVAEDYGLNAKYLGLLWKTLNRDEPSLLLDVFRARWRAAKPTDGAELATKIVAWQQALWTFGTVGHIGKIGGPKYWMDPISPLVSQQEMRFTIPANDGDPITLALVASDAGDGNAEDFVVWQRPRLVAPGRPEILLRDAREFFRADAKEGQAPNQAETAQPKADEQAEETQWGLDPQLFGKHPKGHPVDANSLCVQAPQVIEFQLPPEVSEVYELVTDVALDAQAGKEGSAQVRVIPGSTVPDTELMPSAANVTLANGTWTDNNRKISYSAPVLVNDASNARKRLESAVDEFRQLFPATLCYTTIVPADEAVTLALYHREDEHLCRLMLDDAQRVRLDRLWDELHYISQDSLILVDVLEQLIQYATQDADPKVFEPLREPYGVRAAAFQQRLLETETKHLDALIRWAEKAYRRPLLNGEINELRALYAQLRGEEIPHDEAIRLTLARILVSPQFLYRIEKPAAKLAPARISDWELASRLSYFLWSSLPDEDLWRAAATGRLSDPEVLASQTRRMLTDRKTKRLAREFSSQWLHIYEFDQLDEKSERHFPTFLGLRDAMYEESIQFFTNLLQNDGSVLDILDADYTFVNTELAEHYGIEGVTGTEWHRVDGMKQRGRGGILGLAATLAKHSGASRTSPILRGIWISETLLGEKLPKPPKDVPLLPEDDSGGELSVRQMVELHRSRAECAKCHDHIDPFGFALEGFDAIGRFREQDAAGRAIDATAELKNGMKFGGLAGLRDYLLNQRKDQFVRNFCRKLLGYALGRGVQLSDELLLDEMVAQLQQHDYRISVAVETIVQSKQFQFHRGLAEAEADVSETMEP